MTQVEKVISGLTILSKYGADSLGAEHDEIFAYPSVELDKMEQTDIDTLIKFGCGYEPELPAWRRYV